MTLKEIMQSKLDRLDSVPDAFVDAMKIAQKEALREAIKVLESLETDNGVIVLSKANLAKIEQIGNAISNKIFNGEYSSAVAEFVKEFSLQTTITNDYFNLEFGSFKDNSLFDATITATHDNLIAKLADEPITAQLITPAKDILRTSITNAVSVPQATQAITEFIQGTSEIDGRLVKFAKTTAYDLFANADREYTKVISDSIGAEWFYYQGGILRDSRDFCLIRHGHYYHKKEVQAWASNDWQGKNSNTNSETIFTYAGGYNCKHGILPVSITRVPQDVIDRNIANGNYKIAA